ncbi:cytochrome P450 3A11-like [Oppia nitens]|uniref:cytochrome P450 3A11-like n=1 Tax=Oppia nitens TaxID=1686743 RepID=UPI0023DA4209|nr:cytochrome P450 3A11-like [Oppia nitens]
MLFIDLISVNSLVICLTLLGTLYLYLTRNFNYWSKRGLNGPKPLPIFGTMWQLFFKPLGQINLDNFKKFGKIYGVYTGNRPVLMVADPQLIKDMNIRDFHLFVDRNDFRTGDELSDRTMLSLKGDDWKKMRSIITPTFSSGKMRSMHPIIIDCIKRLDKYLSDKKEVEMKKAMGSLTMDVIASCAFGTKIDTYDDLKSNDFSKYAQKIFRGTWRVWISILLASTFPKLLKWTGIRFFDPKALEFFSTVINTIITKRKSESNGKYNDYIQLMINATNKSSGDTNAEDREVSADLNGEIFGNSETVSIIKNNTKLGRDMTDTDLLATAFIFFVAGYETTAAALAHVLHSLAINQDCQQKLYDEVKKFDGQYDYEIIAQMPYLEACVAETLRVYTTLSASSRIASQDYTIGDTGITLPKGSMVNFDIQSVHYNPDYYPEPDRWNPERFMPYNRDKLVPYTYMPFGLGPRNCVGMRFALMEIKTAVAYLVNKYRFVRTDKTDESLIAKKFEIVLTTGDTYLGIESRN